MKHTGNLNLNTRYYWDTIYSNAQRKYEYLADSHRFFKVVNEIKDGDVFIDIGCGVGHPGIRVKEKYPKCEVWGTDISSLVIEDNKKLHKDIKYFKGYAGDQDFLPDDYFDVVFSGELIEHMDFPEKLFEEAYRILKKGGKMIISTPREEAITSPEHVWEFTEDDVKKFFEDAKFKKVTFHKLNDMEHLRIIFAIGIK